jgi:hypothetical protein
MLRFAFSFVVLMWSSIAALADAQLTVAFDRLRIAEMIEVMRTEGVQYADAIDRDVLNGQGGPVWAAQIQGIYDAHKMQETVRVAFGQMSDEHLRQINRFYGSALGEQVVKLEIAGRRAMMDDDIEAMAQDAYDKVLGEDPAQVAPLRTLVDAGDMIERNVAGAMTANYRFYRGMADGGAFDLSDDEMLAEAWAQEGQIREETQRWLMGYLMLSYRPLDDQDFRDYVLFTQSPAGRALNTAIFDGFNTMYSDISYALGRAAALNLKSSEL